MQLGRCPAEFETSPATLAALSQVFCCNQEEGCGICSVSKARRPWATSCTNSKRGFVVSLTVTENVVKCEDPLVDAQIINAAFYGKDNNIYWCSQDANFCP